MQSSGDATIQVHSDALKYVQSARETQNVVLDDNIYRLLMKNVSRNDPLTREEAQELKSFRDKLTMDQWNGWLQFARNEKNLLKKVKLKQKSPSKTMAIFKQSPNELLQSLMKSEVEQRLTNENDLAESPSERPISDHSADMHLSQSSRAFSLKDIEMPIVDNSEKSEFAPPGPVASNKFDAPEVVVPQSTSDRPQSAATAGVVDEQDTLLRATVTFATAFVEPLPPSVPCTAIPVPAVGTKPESDPDRAAAASPGAKDLSLSTTIPHEIHTQCVEPPGRRNSQDTATHHQSNCLHTSTPSPTSTHSVDMNMEVGVSLQRGSMVGRGSRGGQVGVGSKHRAASAPRERVDASAAQINHSISNKHPGLDSPHFLRSSWTDEHKNINITYSAKQKTFSQTQAPLHPHFFCPKQRGSLSDGFPNKLEHNYHAVNVERSLRHPGAPDHFLNLAQRSLNEGNQTHPNRGYSPSLNLQEAAEIARSTAFRLDSAFSAAQCLLGSFAADQSLTATAPTFLTSQAAEGASNSDKMQTTLSILAEMMSSMEKSKAALEQLSSLHLQGSTASVHADSSGPATARPHRRPPQQQHHDQQQEDHRGSTPTTHQRRRHGSSNHYGSRSGRHRHPAGSAAEHNAGTPSGSSKSSGSEECEGEVEGAGVGFEPSMGYPPSHRMGSSPLETNIFRSVPRGQQRDRWDADSQVLSFEDLSNSYSNSNPARTHSPMQHHPQHRRNTEPDGNTHGTPRSKGEFKWFPDNSLSSSGAKLNAAYAQDKAHEDFSEWNKQMLTSAFAEAGTQQESPHDAKAKLQSQLFEATDSARRASVYNSTLTLTPQGGRSQQFQYSSSGYIWEGVRYSRAQGPVARLCFVSGPRWKTSEDYPVRVDAERRTADVVWREAKLSSGTYTADHASTNASIARGSVLRRERFGFDDVFAGQTAEGRLYFYARQRARKALECGHNLAFLSLACGDALAHDQAGVEPPVSVLLGSGGGTGLISSTIDEIFRFVKPLTTAMHGSHLLYPGGLPTASPSPFVASKVAFEQIKSRVTMSAIILSESGAIYDLLNTSTSSTSSASAAAAHLKRRKSDGRVILCNASRLQLQTTADFDRVMGLLLGKRTALQSVLQTFQLQHSQQQRLGVSASSGGGAYSDPMQSVLAAIDPWASFSSGRNNTRNRKKEGPTAAGICSSSMLISVSVSGGTVSSTQTSVDFHFVSPCGKDWCCPGADINILAELISGLPNQPPTSLLRASPLGMLLMDPRNCKTDFVNVVTVHRESAIATSASVVKEKVEDVAAYVVQGALHSLRIIAQMTQ